MVTMAVTWWKVAFCAVLILTLHRCFISNALAKRFTTASANVFKTQGKFLVAVGLLCVNAIAEDVTFQIFHQSVWHLHVSCVIHGHGKRNGSGKE